MMTDQTKKATITAVNFITSAVVLAAIVWLMSAIASAHDRYDQLSRHHAITREQVQIHGAEITNLKEQFREWTVNTGAKLDDIHQLVRRQ